MIFYVLFPGVIGVLLIVLGGRLVLRSTLDLHPSLKSQYLLLGILALGIGMVLALPGVRILVADPPMTIFGR